MGVQYEQVEMGRLPLAARVASAIAGMLITAVIVTACSGKSASPTTPTPTPTPTVASVSVSGTSSLQERGTTAQFTATVTLSNGTTEDRTAAATWQSDNTAVATVSAQGVDTAVGEGDVTIMATVSNVRWYTVPERKSDPSYGRPITYSAGPDQGSADVYLIDILASHCTSSPQLTYRVFTGEEPGIWTGAGRF